MGQHAWGFEQCIIANDALLQGWTGPDHCVASWPIIEVPEQKFCQVQVPGKYHESLAQEKNADRGLARVKVMQGLEEKPHTFYWSCPGLLEVHSVKLVPKAMHRCLLLAQSQSTTDESLMVMTMTLARHLHG